MIEEWLRQKVKQQRFSKETSMIYLKAMNTRSKGDFAVLLDNRLECLLHELAYPDYKDYD